MFPIQIVQNPNNILVGHNIKFDIKFIEQYFKVKHQCKLYDTSIMHALLDENSNDNTLKSLSAIYTNCGHYEDDINVEALEDEPIEKVIQYNQLDSIVPLKLFEVFYPQLQKQGLVNIFNFITEMLSIFVELEQTGVYINLSKLRVLYNKNAIIIQSLKTKYPNINLTSSAVVGKILKKLGCPILQVTKKGAVSTSKDSLNELLSKDLDERQRMFISDVLEFRKANKLITDHIPRIANNLHNGRFHSVYNLAKGYDESGLLRGTVTGRLSASPNIQNIPTLSEFREIFEVSPEYKYFVTADYSQIELRVAAFLSREPNLIKAFEEKRDVHTSVMCDITNQNYDEIKQILSIDEHPLHRKWYDYRLAVKRVNFGIMYGIGANHLVKLILQMGVKLTEEECKSIIHNWYAQNVRLMQWIREVQDSIILNGYYRTIFGRIRHLPGASRRSDMGNRILRQGINFPIQSAASDICLLGIKNLYNQFTVLINDEIQCRLLMTVHDEISFETKFEDNNFIKQIVNECMIKRVVNDMQSKFGINFDIPLEVGIHISNCWKK